MRRVSQGREAALPHPEAKKVQRLFPDEGLKIQGQVEKTSKARGVLKFSFHQCGMFCAFSKC